MVDDKEEKQETQVTASATEATATTATDPAATAAPATTTTTTSASTPSKGTGPSGSSTSAEFEPPLACVRRMLKNTLPSSTNVGKDASAAFSRACGIFVIYLTACANDFARESKRQTITAVDIMKAVKVREP